MAGSNHSLKSNAGESLLTATDVLGLTVTLDVAAGAFRFEWTRADDLSVVVARGCLVSTKLALFRFRVLEWVFESAGVTQKDGCNSWPASTRALLNRIRKILPLADGAVRIGLLADQNHGSAQVAQWLPLPLPAGMDSWKWLGNEIHEFARLVESDFANAGGAVENGRAILQRMTAAHLGVSPSLPGVDADEPRQLLFDLSVTFDQVKNHAEFVWRQAEARTVAATGFVRCTGADQLTWELAREDRRESAVSTNHRNSIRAAMNRWMKQFPTNRGTFMAFWIKPAAGAKPPRREPEPPFGPNEAAFDWVEDNLVAMAEALRFQFSPLGRITSEMDAALQVDFERYRDRQARKEQRRLTEEAHRREAMARKAAEALARKAAMANKTNGQPESKLPVSNVKSTALNFQPERPPLPPVPVHFEMPPLAWQETAFPLANLQGYFLRERAARWWVSNQSDDLLCLPNCRIERLEYQIRTALRVMGPLRGRALLSDEVGLGKTIEAGLIIKELLTRGMVKKILVLTVPSLVDQWEEELLDKFGLAAVTTNDPLARTDPQKFWGENPCVIASLHTAKQPAQLAIARQVPWDILVVDEAHYLRNRESQAWQAVNALPRHFLLLLTATPVQNSLEELYNLVTLLQPGQLPTPKEFRARFVDPKRPRQPREPEELRRLLGQVMIRNTRANAGLKLPPRRAETVLFEPDAVERAFWQQWETELRHGLTQLTPSQASLWGRLLLQTAGSSPAAWRSALEKFPAAAAKNWREQAPLENSWRRKCELILPLTSAEGGVVIFTQFLETQAALVEFLRQARVNTYFIHGGTPAPERQPITEEFRKHGGALLLTHSGTEGRNLQFSHQLVNFDLPLESDGNRAAYRPSAPARPAASRAHS